MKVVQETGFVGAEKSHKEHSTNSSQQACPTRKTEASCFFVAWSAWALPYEHLSASGIHFARIVLSASIVRWNIWRKQGR